MIQIPVLIFRWKMIFAMMSLYYLYFAWVLVCNFLHSIETLFCKCMTDNYLLSFVMLLHHWLLSLVSHPSLVWLSLFQFVSAAASASAAMIDLRIFGTKKVWVSVLENVLGDHWVTLTQGHGCDIDKQKFACLQDKVRTIQRISPKLCRYISLVMVITWLDFGGILFETLFFFANRCVFSRSNTLLDISQEWLVRLMWNEKEVHRLDAGWTMWPWPVTSSMTFDFSRSNFKIAVSEELLSDVKQKESKSDTGLTVWSCPLTTPMTFTFKSQSLK